MRYYLSSDAANCLGLLAVRPRKSFQVDAKALHELTNKGLAVREKAGDFSQRYDTAKITNAGRAALAQAEETR